MSPLPIRYASHGTAPITIDCISGPTSLTFCYGTTPLEHHNNSVLIELSPTGEGTVVQLQFSGGRLTVSGDVVWTNLRDDLCVHTFTTPTSDFLTVEASATTAAGVVNTGKLYIKAKPSGGLPADEG